MFRLFFTALFFLLTLLIGTASGGEITLVVESVAEVRAEAVNIRFNIRNKGNEPAGDVHLRARFRSSDQRVSVARRIAPSDAKSATLRFQMPSEALGTYPVFVTVAYSDANGVPFSMTALAIVRTADASPFPLSLSAVQEPTAGGWTIRADVSSAETTNAAARLTLHLPNELSGRGDSTRTVKLVNGKATEAFAVQNRGALSGSRYQAFITVELEVSGRHHLTYTDVLIPVKNRHASTIDYAGARHGIFWGFGALSLIGGALWCVHLIRLRRSNRAFGEIKWIAGASDVVVLAAIEIILISHLSPEHLFTNTITTGGDTASHYYTLEYLRHYLLPNGKISGWTPGNYAGFPILQFYFPLPFLAMCGMDLFMPLQVAFKWGTLMGVFLLPVGLYAMLRKMRIPFPAPAIGAVLTLPFLFNPANSMWGGNILSTFAGEFSYSFSLALTPFFLGSLYRGCLDNRSVVKNGIWVFLVGFSHGYTLLFAEAMSVFLLLTPDGFLRRLCYLGKVYALGFCLLAFWLVPLLVFTNYTTSYHTAWQIYSLWEIIPPIFMPVAIVGAAGAVGLAAVHFYRRRADGLRRLRPLAYVGFGLLTAVVMFVAAPKIGVVDIRYVPCGQLMLCLMAAMGLGRIGVELRRWGASWLWLAAVALAVFVWTDQNERNVTEWARWNYQGFEEKSVWPLFQAINRTLAGDFGDPRVVYEHSPHHNAFGSMRAFESLPLFAGRSTLEGLYMQASVTAPFVFYLQSEISKVKSCPFGQYICADMDFDRALAHLRLFNVREMILRSDEAKASARNHPGYHLLKSFGPYEIWEVEREDYPYVVPLRTSPVPFRTDNWKIGAYEWFIRENLSDVYLAFMPEPAAADRAGFAPPADSLETVARRPVENAEACGVRETVRNEEILIETDCIDSPLLIRMSYHPNWKVEGAERIYLVSPSFMLIFPKQERVRLYYGPGWPENVGKALTAIGLMVLLFNLPVPGRGGWTAWRLLSFRLGIPHPLEIRMKDRLGPGVRRRFFAFGVIAAVIFLAGYSIWAYINEPSRIFQRAIRQKDAQRYDDARKGFEHALESAGPLSNMAVESAYYIAICYYLENRNREAVDAFKKMIRDFPRGNRVQEARYHIGLCWFRLGQKTKGIKAMKELIRRSPESPWAERAGERLREQKPKQSSHGVRDGCKSLSKDKAWRS